VNQELTKAADRAKEEHADDLLTKVRRLETRLNNQLDAAEKAKDQRAIVGLAKECRATLELLLRATGQLQSGTNVNVAVGVNMGSQAAAGGSPADFSHLDAPTIAAALMGELPPALLAEVTALLLQNMSLATTGEAVSDREILEAPALPPHEPRNATPAGVVQSRFQPSRQAGT